MINLNGLFPTRSTAPDADYPTGGAQDISAPGAGDGTPWIASIYNDINGFHQALVAAAGITVSGSPETVQASQLLEALLQIQTYASITAFGADPALADNTTFIQNALNAAANGGGVVIPPGNFITDKLTMVDGVTLISVGGELTLKDASDDSIIEIQSGTQDVLLYRLKLNGNAANNAGTPANVGLIEIQSTSGSPSSNITIDGCQVLDAREQGIVVLDGAFQIFIRNCLIDAVAVGAGIDISPAAASTSNIIVENCTILNAVGSGIIATGDITDVRIVNNKIDNTVSANGTDNITGFNEGNVRVSVLGNQCFGNSGDAVSHGINVAGDHIIISNNTIEGFTGTGIVIQEGNTTPTGTLSEHCTISGNSITGVVGNNNGGIYVEDAPLAAITGNSIKEGLRGIYVNRNSATAIFGASVSGNTVDEASLAGVLIDGSLKHSSVSSNTLLSDAFGVSIQGFGTGASEKAINTVVTGNSLRGATNSVKEQDNTVTTSVIVGNVITAAILLGTGSGSLSANNA